MNLFSYTTVDSIVHGLGAMVKRLEQHAAQKEADIVVHLSEAFRRKGLADEAKAHSERATTIAGKINALIQ